jgi:vanillate monooxygenase
MFPLNQWYAVGWDHELKQSPLARTICNEDIVFYRKPDRTIVALEDLCPHRLVPLSNGKLEGDKLVCGYHGLTVDCTGKCVEMPQQENLRGKKLVRTFPVVERHRFAWVWIGEEELADESLVPELHWCSNPNWVADGETFHMKCDYRLLVDNLMDLSHETYVHPTSIGQEEIVESPIETTSDDNSVTVTRWMRDIVPPPFWTNNLGSNENCDRWQICDFSLPANVMIDVGVAPTGSGAPEGDRSQGITGIVIGLMTPETETTTWYHWGMVRDFEIEDKALTRQIRDAQNTVFSEDVDVLEAQQRMITKHSDRELSNFNIDKGGLLARKMIERFIEDSSAVIAAE